MVDFNGINDLSKLNSINNIQGTTAAHIGKQNQMSVFSEMVSFLQVQDSNGKLYLNF